MLAYDSSQSANYQVFQFRLRSARYTVKLTLTLAAGVQSGQVDGNLPDAVFSALEARNN